MIPLKQFAILLSSYKCENNIVEMGRQNSSLFIKNLA